MIRCILLVLALNCTLLSISQSFSIAGKADSTLKEKSVPTDTLIIDTFQVNSSQVFIVQHQDYHLHSIKWIENAIPYFTNEYTCSILGHQSYQFDVKVYYDEKYTYKSFGIHGVKKFVAYYQKLPMNWNSSILCSSEDIFKYNYRIRPKAFDRHKSEVETQDVLARTFWEQIQTLNYMWYAADQLIRGANLPPRNDRMYPKDKMEQDSLIWAEKMYKDSLSKVRQSANQPIIDSCYKLHKAWHLPGIKKCLSCMRSNDQIHRSFEFQMVEQEYQLVTQRVQSLVAMADRLFNEGNYVRAIVYYEKVLEYDPEMIYAKDQCELAKDQLK